jgi:homoserine kinase
VERPKGLRIRCANRIPLRSGLGSSAAAVVAGLMGANALMGENLLSRQQIVRLAAEIEGHPDNVAAAIQGGLTISATDGEEIMVEKAAIADWDVVVVLPEIKLETREARAALPKEVPLQDAVFNIGRTALVVEALRSGNRDALRQAMEDRLHQPYRLRLIPGAAEAIAAAREAGAAAALSGAGPAVIAFPSTALRASAQGGAEKAAEAMEAAFREAGVATRRFLLKAAKSGAEVN